VTVVCPLSSEMYLTALRTASDGHEAVFAATDDANKNTGTCCD